jgi:YidC/Oxa1 family membrane protein insertase
VNFHLFSLDWFYTAIAWVMKQWHAALSTFLPADYGITWALSIVLLVITVRLVLFRFFIRQVKSQRAMQEIQPEIQKLKAQYGSDRQGFSQAVMALQKERGVNPLAGCLPILPQIPVFIALLHVLRRLAPNAQGLYSWDDELTNSAARAKLFGAPISSSFNMTGDKEHAILQIATYTNIRIVAMTLIVVMCVTTFFTQKQIQKKSGPVEGQAAMVQKLLLYGMPLGLFVSGFLFPIGVLIYWLTNNLWTLGQQFYILKKMPPPGSAAAAKAKEADKPAVDPRSLAPRPGAKPVRDRSGRPVTPGRPAEQTPPSEPAVDDAGTGSGATASSATGDGGAPSSDGPTVNGTPVEPDGPPRASNGSGPDRPRNKAGQGNRGKRKRR